MNVEQESFRTDLRSASLCVELDCNTIFDATRHRDCENLQGIQVS
jgi:hypothetical protein